MIPQTCRNLESIVYTIYTYHCFIGNQRIAGFRGRFQVVLELFTNRVLQRLFKSRGKIGALGPQGLDQHIFVSRKEKMLELTSYVLIRKKIDSL